MVKMMALAALVVATATWAVAGGEMVEGGRVSSPSVPKPSGNSIPRSKIGPPMGACIEKDAPLPSPSRRIGSGFSLNEFYGPTYYYPSAHNVYEGLNPTYYPFFHPRLWPNYKAEGSYCPGQQCGASRSGYNWDGYDDWVRDARYGEHQ